jgi:hypothetical protein
LRPVDGYRTVRHGQRRRQAADGGGLLPVDRAEEGFMAKAASGGGGKGKMRFRKF